MAGPVVVAITLFTTGVGSRTALAQNRDGWHLRIAPSVTALKIAGARTVGSAATAVRFGDSFIDLSMAGTVYIEVGKGGWNVILDMSYVGVGDRFEPRDETSPLAGASLSFRMATGELLVSRRWRRPDGADWFEFLWGVRYTSLGQDLEVAGDSAHLSLDFQAVWVDPVVGARFLMVPYKRLGFLTRVDIGGFGIGAYFAWSFSAGFVYRLSSSLELLVEYRTIDVDYQRGRPGEPGYFLYDGTTYGLTPRLVFSF